MKVTTCIALLLINFRSSQSTPSAENAADSADCEGFIFMRESGEIGMAKYDPESQKFEYGRSVFIDDTTPWSGFDTFTAVQSTTLAAKLDGTEAATVTLNGKDEHDVVFQTIYSGEKEIGPESTKRHRLYPDSSTLSALENSYYGDTFEYSQTGNFFAFDYNGNTTVYDRRKGAESTDSVFRKYSPRSRFRTARKETPASRTQIARVEYGVASARLEIVDVVSNNIVESVDLGAESLEYPELRDISFNENGTIALVTLFGESSANLQAVRLESSRDAVSSGSSAGVVMWEDWFVLDSSIPPSVIVADEWVYYAHHFNIHKLNIASGNQEWVYVSETHWFTGNRFEISKIDLLDDNGVIFVSLQDTEYIVLDSKNARRMTSYEPGDSPELLDPPVVFTASHSGKNAFARVKYTTRLVEWELNPFASFDFETNANYYAFAAVYSGTFNSSLSLDKPLDFTVLGKVVDSSRLVAAPRFAAIKSCPPSLNRPFELATGFFVLIAAGVGAVGFATFLLYKSAMFNNRRQVPKRANVKLPVADAVQDEEIMPAATQAPVPVTPKVIEVNSPVRAVDDDLPEFEYSSKV